MNVGSASLPVGALLREWRERRRLSQEKLAEMALVSTRHLSYVENGRSRPSREVLLYLADQLEIPTDARNRLLLAAGYAPAYIEATYNDAGMAAVREGLGQLLASHEPFPAVVIDRRWDVVARNRSAVILVEGVAPHLLVPPINALRLVLHPDGLAARIRNLEDWSSYLLQRLDARFKLTADPTLDSLAAEARSYLPANLAGTHRRPMPVSSPFLSLHLEFRGRELHLLNLLARFDTLSVAEPADLTFEAFYPADDETSQALRSA